MKNISELANVSCINSAREKKTEHQPLDPQCARLVDALFIKFGLLCREYDALYADSKRENAEKVQWIRAFEKNNLKHQSQIQNGIDQTELHKWGKPPQLGQFLEWCQKSSENAGLPDIYAAFNIAGQINQIYSDYTHPHVPTHTVIKHVLTQIGSIKFRGMTEKEAFKVFAHYYSVACRQYMDGLIENINLAIPKDLEPRTIDRTKSNDARLVAMEKIKKMGVLI